MKQKSIEEIRSFNRLVSRVVSVTDRRVVAEKMTGIRQIITQNEILP
ncbi:MAG TPA: hypothetical protein VL978_13730 [Puia sp.]|nr:hypothetical protein [Puia sp.]